MKRLLDCQKTTRSSTILEIPCLEDLRSRQPGDAQSVEQDLVQADNPAPVEINSLQDVVKDNPSPLLITTSVAEEVEPAGKTLRRSSPLSVLQNVSRGQGYTSLLNGGKESRPEALTTVILRPRKASNHHHKRLTKTRADSIESGGETLDPMVSVISAKWGMKRQANIVIEVPPRPKDWWTWQEGHSPLFTEVLKQSTVDLEPVELPPRKRP